MKKTLQLDFSNQIAHIEVSIKNRTQIITKTWGKDFGWSEEDARHVIAMHRHYIANLQAIGITTSRPLTEKVVMSEDRNEYLVRSSEKFFEQGDSLSVLIMSRDKTELIKAITEQARLLAEMLFRIPPLRKENYSVDWLWMTVAPSSSQASNM